MEEFRKGKSVKRKYSGRGREGLRRVKIFLEVFLFFLF